MTFFSWIKKQLQMITPTIRSDRRKRRSRHPDYHQKKKLTPENNFESDQTDTQQTNQSKTNDTLKNEDDSLNTFQNTTSFEMQSQVIFTYLDKNDRQISSSDIIRGIVGENIQFKLPDFSDYYLTSIENFTHKFEKSDQEVTLRFALKNGLPIMIYCLDTDTGQILKSVQIISGKLGQSYTVNAPKINGFRVISSTGPTFGHFDHQTQGVIFAYRRTHWETVQPVEYFVKLKDAHDVYDSPQGRSLKTGLPARIIIKIFARIDLSDKSSWLNIGGFEWIKNSNLEPSDPPIHNLIDTITKTSRNPARLAGTIDYVPNKAIAVFDKPYGNKINALIHGSRVSISATIVDDQNLIWYELNGNGVVPKMYVIVDRS
ncbi:MucBP domain-containing protein [Lentilactobacillus hilgardii]